MLELKNQNTEPLNTDVACVKQKKLKGHSKIKEQINRKLYKWIKLHTQVVQSPILNDCLKVSFDDHV